MLSTPRRSLLGSLAALTFAPAVVKASSLMPLSTAEIGDTFSIGESTSWDWLVADMGRELRRRLSQRLDVIGHQPSNVIGKQLHVNFELHDSDLRLSKQELRTRFVIPAAAAMAKNVPSGAKLFSEALPLPEYCDLAFDKSKDEKNGLGLRGLRAYHIGMDSMLARFDVRYI